MDINFLNSDHVDNYIKLMKREYDIEVPRPKVIKALYQFFRVTNALCVDKGEDIELLFKFKDLETSNESMSIKEAFRHSMRVNKECYIQLGHWGMSEEGYMHITFLPEYQYLENDRELFNEYSIVLQFRYAEKYRELHCLSFKVCGEKLKERINKCQKLDE